MPRERSRRSLCALLNQADTVYLFSAIHIVSGVHLWADPQGREIYGCNRILLLPLHSSILMQSYWSCCPCIFSAICPALFLLSGVHLWADVQGRELQHLAAPGGILGEDSLRTGHSDGRMHSLDLGNSEFDPTGVATVLAIGLPDGLWVP